MMYYTTSPTRTQPPQSKPSMTLNYSPTPSSFEIDGDSNTEDGSTTIRVQPLSHPFSPPFTPNPPPPSTRLALPQSNHRPIQSTPNRITRFTPTRHTSETGITSEQQGYQVNDMHPSSRFVDPLDALSDRTRRRALLKLGFLTWKQVFLFWKEAHKEAHAARRTMIIGYSWLKWRSKLGKRQRQVSMVEGVARTRLKSAVLLRWRVATLEKQRMRRKMYLLQTTKNIQDRINNKLMIQVFTKWTLLTRLSSYQRIKDTDLKKTVISRWIESYAHISQIHEMAIHYDKQVRLDNLLGKIIIHWRWKVELRNKEFQVVNMLDRNVQLVVLAQWRQSATLHRLAHDFWIRSTTQTWLRVWIRRRHRLKKIQRKAKRIIAVRNENLMGTVMNLWIIQERGRLLGRVLFTRFMKNAVMSWLTRLDQVTRFLDAKRQVFQKTLAKRQTSTVLKKWKEVYQHKSIHLASLAIDRQRVGLVARYLNRWIIQFAKNQTLSSRSFLNWRIITLQRSLVIWSQRYRESRILKVMNRKKDQLLKKTLTDWAAITRQKQKDTRILSSFEAKVQPIRKAWVLKIWAKRINDLKQFQLTADQKYLQGLLSEHFVTWIDRFNQIRGMYELATGFAEIQKIESRDRMLDFWRRKAHNSRKLSGILAAWYRSRDKLSIRFTWSCWEDRLFEKRLHPLEIETRQLVDHRLREIPFDIWVGKTQTLPALRMNRQRLKVLCLKHWIKLTCVKKLRRKALSLDRQLVLVEAFKVWWGKCNAIKASRIVSRFSRPSTFSSGARRRTKSGQLLPDLTRRNLNKLLSTEPSGSRSSQRLTDLVVPPQLARRGSSSQVYVSTTSGDDEESEAVMSETFSQPVPPVLIGRELNQSNQSENGQGVSHNEESVDDQACQQQQDEDGGEEEEEEEEDKTILGDVSSIQVREEREESEASTTETSAMTEHEIKQVFRRRTTRIFNAPTRRPITTTTTGGGSGGASRFVVDDEVYDEESPTNIRFIRRPTNLILHGLRHFDNSNTTTARRTDLSRFNSK